MELGFYSLIVLKKILQLIKISLTDVVGVCPNSVVVIIEEIH